MIRRYKTLDDVIADEELFKKQPKVADNWHDVWLNHSVHVSGRIPVKMIEDHRKSDPQEVKQRKIEQYQPITQGGMLKGLDKTSRIFRDAKFAIKFGSERLKDIYMQSRIPTSDGRDISIKDYVLDRLIHRAAEDPNAVTLTLPKHPTEELDRVYTSVSGDEVLTVTTPNFDAVTGESIGFEEVIIPHNRLYYFSEDFLVFRDRYDWVYDIDENGNEKKEKFFWIIDRSQIWLWIPVLEGNDVVYRLAAYYFHNQGEIPADTLGGRWVEKPDMDGFYDSFWAAYSTWGNKAIVRMVDLDTVIDLNGYPVKMVKGQPCRKCNGKGKVKVPGFNTKFEDCSACGGEGVTYDISPSAVYRKKATTFDLEDDKQKPVDWAHGPVEPLRYLDDNLSWLLMQAEKSISVMHTESAQAAEAKRIDRDNLYDMMFRMSEHFYGLLENKLKYIGGYTLNRRVDVVVKRPNDFAIKGYEELIQERKELQNAGATRSLKMRSELELMKKRYPGEPIMYRKIELLYLLDPLYGCENQVEALPHEARKHKELPLFLELLAMEMGDRFIRPESLKQIIQRVESEFPEETVTEEQPGEGTAA